MPPVPTVPGVDPQAMNQLLIMLAQRNAAAEALGMGNPYGSLLSVLQGSPAYKGMIETATRGAGLPFVGPEAAAKAAGAFPYDMAGKQYQAALDRANKEVEMLGAARLDPAEILVEDGKGGKVTVQGTREQRVRASYGFAVPELGIPGIPAPGAAAGAAAGAPQAGAPQAGAPQAGALASKPFLSPGEIAAQQERGKAPYTFVDATIKLPGENQEREMKMSVEDYNKINAGQEVTINGVKIPAMTGIKLGKSVYSPEQTATIQAAGTAQAEMYKSGQKALDTAHEAVRAANQRTPYYGNMLAAMQAFQPGATAEARLTGMQYLKDLGIIKGDNVSQGEALKLAAERLAFLAVPPGQGSWAIVERQMLKNSIGSIALTPEGLTDAIRMMQQLDDYDRKVSEIHRKVADQNKGLPNLLEAQRQVEALGPPLTTAQQTALERLQQQPATPPAAPGGGGNATKSANEIIQNGWRYDATTHRPIGPVQ
jgi:hypothetical protein